MSTDFERLAARDQTLASMVQCWRQRTDPNSIPGLVTSPTRRTRELSKTEVARLAGISVKWYSKLEAGESAQFSDAILERLAFTFRLNDAERLALYHHATGRAPAPRDTEPDAMAAMDADMQRLLDKMLPHPAYISDVAWNVVAHNNPSREMYPWVYERNIMRWAFLYPGAREQLVNWKESWAVPFLAQIRTAAAQYPDHEQLKKLVEDILDGCPEAQELWDRHDFYEHPDGDIRHMRIPHGGAGEVPVRIMALAPLRNRQLRFIVAFHGV
ncbi:helix-turn-helix transcriptional regulator [Kitasatospora brasiliensis]|uniref:helix-turn-helix transcriptional regulator n=1 Tax=Kitasatospora brasiliensis TaxID=3058040 RepID=UPI00292D96AD|nr:helix-turn-helix transcriptional regulator [Kitasatospora sp. K002]